jgi:hypothetical protein
MSGIVAVELTLHIHEERVSSGKGCGMENFFDFMVVLSD